MKMCLRHIFEKKIILLYKVHILLILSFLEDKKKETVMKYVYITFEK